MNSVVWMSMWLACMDEWTMKTPNPLCRLFFKIDLLIDFAALCLKDFIDWRCIHSWFVFSTQLVNCCLHGRRNYTCVLLPLYLLSDLFPPRIPPSQTKCTGYTDSVRLWVVGVGGCWIVLFLTRFRTFKIASPPHTMWPIKTTLRDWCLSSSFVRTLACFQDFFINLRHYIVIGNNYWFQMTETGLAEPFRSFTG